MNKQIKIRIFPDGRVQADVAGVKGSACTNYIRILEDVLKAESIDSAYTPEYYETQSVEAQQIEQQQIRGQQGT